MERPSSLEKEVSGGAQVMDRKYVIFPTSEASRVSKGTTVGNLAREGYR